MQRRERPLILAIDDTDANRFVVTGILRKAGYDVVEAATGREAIEQLQRHSPDLVIADVRLPDTTGFEIARKLRGQDDRDLIPLLFISASFTGPGAHIQGLESGADGYLTHPVDPGVLLATVRSLLRIRRAEDIERFLADASQSFSRSLDPDDVTGELVTIATDRVADGCVVCQIGPEGPHIVAVAHANPEKTEALRAAFVAHPPGSESGDLIAAPFQQSVVPYTPSGNRGAALALLGFASAVTAPLVARGNVFGSVTFYSHAASFDDASVRMFVDVASRAAIAADNARLFRIADEARRDAQVANSAKMDFLAAMSHELRTPLNAIAGYLDLLTLGIRGPLTDQQREDLKRISLNQRHLSSLIEDILNYARLEAGRLNFDIQRVRVHDALTEVLALVSPSYAAKGVDIKASAPDDAIAMADIDRLRQVLLNVLGNAVKFTSAGGAVDLSAACFDSVVRIDCRDTGRGIPPNKLESIFEPFVQVAHTFSEERKGLGLGLAISRDLMRGMRGDLTVSSEVDKGSVFSLTLPRG